MYYPTTIRVPKTIPFLLVSTTIDIAHTRIEQIVTTQIWDENSIQDLFPLNNKPLTDNNTYTF